MRTVAIVAALAGSAAAFAPSQVSRTNSTSIKAMADMVGGEGPEPIPFAPSGTSKNFDPVGFAEVRFSFDISDSLLECLTGSSDGCSSRLFLVSVECGMWHID